MDLGLNGKSALVLGGNKGLGKGVALALAAEGMKVAIAGRDKAALERTTAELQARSPGSIGHEVDLGDSASVSRLLEGVDRAFPSVDVLVLNGGGPPPFAAASFDPEEWRRQFDSMFLAFVRITNHVLPRMREQRWGRILVPASTSVREPIPGLTASNTLRAAIAGWAKSLASEVAADGVTVNLLLTGRFATNRTDVLDRLDAERRNVDPAVVAAESQAEVPAGRYGDIAEFGALAAFLASKPAAYITGAAIPIDGGLMRAMI